MNRGSFSTSEILLSLIIGIALIIIVFYVLLNFNEIRSALVNFFQNYNPLERFK